MISSCGNKGGGENNKKKEDPDSKYPVELNVEQIALASDQNKRMGFDIEPNGTLHIGFTACHEQTCFEGVLARAYGLPGSWTVEKIDEAGDRGWYVQYILDGNVSHLFYQNHDGHMLMHTYNPSNAWQIEEVDPYGWTGWWTSAARSTTGEFKISYVRSDSNFEDADLKIAIGSQGSWGTTTVDTHDSCGWKSCLALDNDNNPHIAYTAENKELRYVTGRPGKWTIETVDNSAGAGACGVAIATDAKMVHLAYCLETGTETDTQTRLMYAVRTSDGWEIETVDKSPSAGLFPSLALDPKGGVHIAYKDEDSGELRYARFLGVAWHIYTLYDNGSQPVIKIDDNGTMHVVFETDGWVSYGACTSCAPAKEEE